MSRHSKNANTRSFFTSGEREKEKGVWGTKKQRLDELSQRQFDQCQCCLHELRDPVASPHGCLYCRECILDNLLSQKAAIDVQVTKWKADNAARAMTEEVAIAQEAQRKLEHFASAEVGVKSTLGSSSTASSASAAPSRKRERMDERSHSEKVADALGSSPWLPDAAGGAAAKTLAPPDTMTKCPASGKPLKAKQLIPVRLSAVGEGSPSAGAGSGAGSSSSAGGTGSTEGVNRDARWQCPACLKPIVYQKTILLAGCGHVTCDGCTAKFVVPSKSCFVCARAVAGKAEVIPLQVAGSAYSGHEGTQATAQKYTPSLMA